MRTSGCPPVSLVVHVVFGGQFPDGREVVAAHLAAEQGRQLAARIVVVGVGPPAMHGRLSRRITDYRAVESGSRGTQCLAALGATRQVLAGAGGRSLLHAHGLRALAVAGVLHPRRGLGTVYTAHGAGGTRPQRSARALLERALCRRVDQVIVCSQHLAFGLGRVSQHATHVVLNGAPSLGPVTPDDRAYARALLGVHDADPVIGIVGRLAPEKRHDVFLAAGADLVHRFPRAQLLVVGDGPDRRRLTRLARTHGLARHVRFLGHVDDVLPVYRSLDLLLHTSDVEGTPLAVVEAMSAGVPVVATAVGGVPALVRDGIDGLLVPRREPIALAAAATTVLADAGVRAGMQEALARRGEGPSSASRMCREVSRVYDAAVGS